MSVSANFACSPLAVRFFTIIIAALTFIPSASAQNLFTPPANFTTGPGPEAVVMADLNGDGKRDLISVNDDGTISVLLNTTAPGATTPAFATAQSFAAGSSPSSVVAVDINGDGRLDLVVVNQSGNTVSVLLNTTPPGATTASFAAQVTFAVGPNPFHVVAADINGDGRPDLAVTNLNSNNVSVLLNTTAPGATTPSFAAQLTFATGSFPEGAVVADFNGDGRPDLVVVNGGEGSLGVLLNTTAPGATTPSFAAQQAFAAGPNPFHVVAVDINGDGMPDLVVAHSNTDGTVSVLLNTTTPGAAVVSFTVQPTFSVGSNPLAVAAADLNGDGHPDLVIPNTNDGTLSVLLNTTAPGALSASFVNQQLFPGGNRPLSVAVGDLNGDGKPDVALASNGDSTVVVLLNNIPPINPPGNGMSMTAQQPFVVVDPNDVVLADFNGDGKLDQAVVDINDSTVTVLLSTTTPGDIQASFLEQGTFAVGSNPRALAVADFNGDGLPDLVVANSDGTVSVLLNTTAPGDITPAFTAHVTFAVGNTPLALAVADFNGDGLPDVAVVNSADDTVSVLLNTTAPGSLVPTFATQQVFATGMSPFSITVADFNGDGQPDLAIGCLNSMSVSVLLNTTAPGAVTPTFAAQQPFASGGSPAAVAAADVNGDGIPDLVVANSNANSVSVLLNTTAPGATAPAFTTQVSFPAGTDPAALAVGDINGDGRPDVVVVESAGNTVGVLLNATPLGAATPTFALVQHFAVGSIPTSVAVGDLNGDGKPDLVVSNFSDNTTSVLINLGGTTTANTSAGTSTVFGQPVTFTAAIAVELAGNPNTPTGTVQFQDTTSSSDLGAPANVTAGVATFTTSTLSAGSHSISGLYSGDATFWANTVPPITQVVTQAASATALSSSNNPSVFGATVTFTVTVTDATNGSTGTPTGSVTLMDGVATLATGTLDGSGIVSFSTSSLALGSHSITAVYAGDSNFTGSTSTPVNQVVLTPPVITKAFGAASIPLNGSTTLQFTIQNNNAATTLTGVGFSDTLPAGLVVSTPNGLTGACGAGTITATAGSNAVSLSGGTVAGGSSCSFTINVTGTTTGTKNNTTGNVTSNEAGSGGTASASIDVVAPPLIAKSFGLASVSLNGSTNLAFTITNPAANVAAETGVAFTDTLPAGLVVATPNGLTNTCGGTATAVAGSGSISLSGGIIAVNSNCTLAVNVTGTTSGVKNNTTGNVTSTNGGTGNTASASLNVVTPPTITKSFGAATIPLNASTSLTFTVTNPNAAAALSGLAFTDTLPAGLVVATPNGLVNTGCGGTATAVAGSGSVSLSAGTLAASANCTITVNVTGTTAGPKNNSVQVTSTGGGTGNTSNASVTVVAAPVIIKAFGAASIPLNGSTSLTFTIQNNNAGTTLTGIGFSDTLPAGLVVSTPNGLTGSCGGGTITATAGSGSVALSGATLATSASCTFSVNVTGTAAGVMNNSVQVTSNEGGTGNTSNASITVVSPPVIVKAFGAANIAVGSNTTLSFTLTNPAANTVALTGVAFTDTFPGALIVATPNGLTSTCGGTATATAGSNSVTLTGATVAAASSCNVTVTVTGPAGSYANTSGAVSSTNGGTGNTASASLLIMTPGSVFTLTPIETNVIAFQGDTATFAITVNATAPLGPITFSCSGQPAGTNCQFSAPPPTPGSGNVLMTIQTFRNTASLAVPPGGSRTAPLYAALFLPVLGLVAVGLSKKNRKRTRLRFAMALSGLALIMALGGCGGSHDNGTVPGVYNITVTATTASAQATSNVTLELRHR